MTPEQIRGRDTNPTGVRRLTTLSAAFDPDLADLPEFAALRDYWAGRRNGGRLPRYGDIDPLDLRGHLGTLFVAQATDDGADFRFRLMGTKLTLVHGEDFTGRTITESLAHRHPAYGAEAVWAYRRCLRRGRPLLAHGQVVWADRDHLDFRALHLPCSSDGAAADIILGKIAFERAGTVTAR